jgi:hypothetical protein
MVVVGGGVSSIGASAFQDCIALESIVLPDSARAIDKYAFSGCRMLRSASLGSGLKSIGESAFQFTGLASVSIPGTVTAIGPFAFYCSGQLESAVIGSGVVSIGRWAFCNCGLKSIIIPASVADMGDSVFIGCNLGSIFFLGSTPTLGGNLGSSAVARYSVGNSTWAGYEGKLFGGLPAKPMAQPTAPGVPVAAVGDSSATLNWAAPSFNGGAPVTDYIVEYSKDKGLTWAIFDDGVSTSNSATVTGLTNGSAYIFRIAAVNLMGASPISGSSSAVVPKAKPNAPSNVIGKAGQGQVTLTWTTPSYDGGSAITDYVVQYSSSNGANWTTFSDGVSASATATVTGLTNGTGYVFRVVAANAAGTGTASVQSSAFTPRTVPSTPSSVFGSAGNGRVILSWTVPAFDGASAITDYVVQYSSDTGSNWATFNDGASTSTAATVTGLTNGTIYVFRVAAVNSVGTGTASAPSAAVTPRPPSIATLGTLSAVSATYGTPSAVSTLTVTGQFLAGSIVATAPAGFEVSSNNVTFGSTATFAAVSGTASGTAFVRLAAKIVAGTYSGNVTFTSAGATQVVAAMPASSVLKKALTITGLSAQAKTYDGTLAATITGTPAYVGLMNGESFSVLGTPVAAFTDKNTGTSKTVLVTGYLAPSTNYTVSQPAGLTASVTARPITVTAEPKTKTYGSADPALSFQLTSGRLASGDALTGALSRAPGETVTAGPYQIGKGTLSAGSNYAITYVAANLTITPKALTISGLTAQPKTYDGTLAATITGTATLFGKIGSDDVALVGKASGTFASKNVGTGRSVMVGGLTLAGTTARNYTLSPLVLSANIVPRELTVRAEDKTKLVNAVNPATSYTITGFAAGESQATALTGVAAASHSALQSSPVGSYPIRATPGTLAAKDGNYVFKTFTDGALKVITTPGAPTRVVGIAGSRSVTLSWTPPVNQGNSAVTDYLIEFSSNNGTTWQSFTDTVATTTSAVVTGLTPNVNYVFRVRAVNAAGNGTYSVPSAAVRPRT